MTDLQQALASINKVLQVCSVSAVSFNFKKRADSYRVWFNLIIPRDTNLKILQGLSAVPEITEVETDSSERDYTGVGPPGDAGAQNGRQR